jgi:hypothetical protein
MTWTVNQAMLDKMSPEQRKEAMNFFERQKVEYEATEARQAKEKRDRQARQYPTLVSVIEKMKKINVPHVNRAILKRLHIALSYLRTPPEVHALGHVPTLEEALAILGRAFVNVSLMNEIGKILHDYSGYSTLMIYPREVFELKAHCEDTLKLAEQMVRAITFQMIKEDGRYEPGQDGHSGSNRPEPGQTEQGDPVQ